MINTWNKLLLSVVRTGSLVIFRQLLDDCWSSLFSDLVLIQWKQLTIVSLVKFYLYTPFIAPFLLLSLLLLSMVEAGVPRCDPFANTAEFIMLSGTAQSTAATEEIIEFLHKLITNTA